MISVKVDTSGLLRLQAQVEGFGRQLPFATKTALNATAKHVVERENQEIRSLFDRPNPRTQNAVKIFKGATKTNLAVLVGIDDGQERYSAIEISACPGDRRKSRAEAV